MKQIKITSSVTNRSEIANYLNDISKFNVLSIEDEERLAIDAANGCEKAKDKLIKSNLRLVVSVAKQYQGCGLSLYDLISEGNVGLIYAINTFDVTRGFKFISYAVWYIRKYIINALDENGSTIRKSKKMIGIYSKIKAASEKFVSINDREPNAYELADILNMDVQTINDALISSFSVCSADTQVSDDEDSACLSDFFKSESKSDLECDKNSLHNTILDVLDSLLSKKEKEIIMYSFGIGCEMLTINSIGDKYDLTIERIRQIKDDALEKIRNNSKAKKILIAVM